MLPIEPVSPPSRIILKASQIMSHSRAIQVIELLRGLVIVVVPVRVIKDVKNNVVVDSGSGVLLL
jgi:hypothetical protein